MFNKQMKLNIEQLDLQIGTLSKELEDMVIDSKYDVIMGKLERLTEVRSKMTRVIAENEKDVVLELDKQIIELSMLIRDIEEDEVYKAKMKKLEDLTNIRCQLAESRVKESNMPAIISGVVGIASILLVLKHEQANVITTKAFGMLPKMFRG